MRVDGKTIAQEILESLSRQVILLKQKNITPHLAIILIGDDPASQAYVRQKKIKGEVIGVKVAIKHLSTNISESELLSTIEKYNNNNNIHGIIVQRPLPQNINLQKIDQAINPEKDVDAFNSKTKFDSPISMAILAILEHIYYSLKIKNTKFTQWLCSKKIVVIGKGETGGAPIIKKLKKLGIQPIIVDSKAHNPQLLTKQADIITSAVGKPNVLNVGMIKRGAILISIGLHKGTDGKLHGDYEEDEIKDIASFYTPTPGGVGPVNVAMLLKNVVYSAESFRC